MHQIELVHKKYRQCAPNVHPSFEKWENLGKQKRQKPYNIKVSAFKEKLGKLISAGCRHYSCLCISACAFFVPFLSPLIDEPKSIQKQVIKSCFNGFSVADNLVHKNKPPWAKEAERQGLTGWLKYLVVYVSYFTALCPWFKATKISPPPALASRGLFCYLMYRLSPG